MSGIDEELIVTPSTPDACTTQLEELADHGVTQTIS